MREPMRVAWTTPNHERRDAARREFEREMRRPESELHMLKARFALAESQAAILRKFPDLDAVDHHFGTLLQVEYVPEMSGATMTPKGSTVITKLREAKWVALVATEHGMREMDPGELRAMWAMAPGDPISGTVTGDDLLERGKVDRQWAEDVATAVLQIRDRKGSL